MKPATLHQRLAAPCALFLCLCLVSPATLATQSRHNRTAKRTQTPPAKTSAQTNGNGTKGASRSNPPGTAASAQQNPRNNSAAQSQNAGAANQGQAQGNQGAQQQGAQAAPAGANAEPPPCEFSEAEQSESAGLRIKLYYAREAAKIAEILTALAKIKGSGLRCLVAVAASADEIILYGPKEKRDHARRIIAALDLPRPGVNLEMWGIQISSDNPEKMAIVLPAIRDEINRTQQAVRQMYQAFQQSAQQISPLDPRFQVRIQCTLGYKSALDAARPLSLTDILLRMIAAEHPYTEASRMVGDLNCEYRKLAEHLDSAHRESLERLLSPKKPKKLKPQEDAATSYKGPAFENFFRQRGLNYTTNGSSDPTRADAVDESAFMARIAILEFGFHYSQLVHNPASFSPYYLQQSAEILNTRLQAAVDALNFDMQMMFVEPTLLRIQEIVRNFDEVSYAQVGKTTVASLSGVTTEVNSQSVSAIDVTPPLQLSELLAKAKSLSESATTFIPKETKPGAAAATELTSGALPISQIIGLIGALGEERAVWRQLQSGISLTITPNVLRNMTSAELQVDLKTGDPLAGTQEEKSRTLSRVSQHNLKTSVYVNALDFFDLSAFISQSTLNGGRGYVPLLGPFWRGLFSDVPGIGKMFSWQRPPKTVYHESLVLTNSFITPTVMGIALLYPTELDADTRCNLDDAADKTSHCHCTRVNNKECKDKECKDKMVEANKAAFKCRETKIDEDQEELRKMIRDKRVNRSR
jgi:hypothetical protein